MTENIDEIEVEDPVDQAVIDELCRGFAEKVTHILNHPDAAGWIYLRGLVFLLGDYNVLEASGMVAVIALMEDRPRTFAGFVRLINEMGAELRVGAGPV